MLLGMSCGEHRCASRAYRNKVPDLRTVINLFPTVANQVQHWNGKQRNLSGNSQFSSITWRDAGGCHFLLGNQAGFRNYKGCRDIPFVSTLPYSCFPEPISSFPAWNPSNKVLMQCESGAKRASVWDDGLWSVSHSRMWMKGC